MHGVSATVPPHIRRLLSGLPVPQLGGGWTVFGGRAHGGHDVGLETSYFLSFDLFARWGGRLSGGGGGRTPIEWRTEGGEEQRSQV